MLTVDKIMAAYGSEVSLIKIFCHLAPSWPEGIPL